MSLTSHIAGPWPMQCCRSYYQAPSCRIMTDIREQRISEYQMYLDREPSLVHSCQDLSRPCQTCFGPSKSYAIPLVKTSANTSLQYGILTTLIEPQYSGPGSSLASLSPPPIQAWCHRLVVGGLGCISTYFRPSRSSEI